MVKFGIKWTLYTGAEYKAKTNCALIAQFETAPTSGMRKSYKCEAPNWY